MAKTFTNLKGLPKPIADAIRNTNTYDLDQSDISVISVTTLIDSAWIRMLRRNHSDEITVDVDDLIYSIKGSAVHNILENAGSSYIREFRTKKHFPEFHVDVSGKLDCLDLEDSILWDWKTQKVTAYSYDLGKPKEKYILQLNILRYLLKHRGIMVSNLKLGMFYDGWNYRDYLIAQSKNMLYPPRRIMEFIVPIMADNEIENYIKSRLIAHGYLYDHEHHYELALYEKNIELCTPEERWQQSDKFAVYNGESKSASKLTDTEEEAIEWIRDKKTPSVYRIEKREGKNVRCMSEQENYCDVKQFCSFYKSLTKDTDDN